MIPRGHGLDLARAAMLALSIGCSERAARGRTPAPEPAPAPIPEPAPGPGPDLAPAPASWPARPLPSPPTDWCSAEVPALDEQTCVVLPAAPTREILVYLHGIVPPTPESDQKSNLHRVVSAAARRAGIVAMLPRGVQGLAPPGLSTWWGWPTAFGAYTRYGKALVESIEAKQALLESVIGARFEVRYVAGSSSGAWFAGLLALHGGITADGFGSFSGGGGLPPKDLALIPSRAFYFGFGTYDTVGDGVRALARALERAGWPVRVAEHRTGHGAREVYVDEAIAFWRETDSGSQGPTTRDKR